MGWGSRLCACVGAPESACPLPCPAAFRARSVLAGVVIRVRAFAAHDWAHGSAAPLPRGPRWAPRTPRAAVGQPRALAPPPPRPWRGLGVVVAWHCKRGSEVVLAVDPCVMSRQIGVCGHSVPHVAGCACSASKGGLTCQRVWPEHPRGLRCVHEFCGQDARTPGWMRRENNGSVREYGVMCVPVWLCCDVAVLNPPPSQSPLLDPPTSKLLLAPSIAPPRPPPPKKNPPSHAQVTLGPVTVVWGPEWRQAIANRTEKGGCGSQRGLRLLKVASQTAPRGGGGGWLVA